VQYFIGDFDAATCRFQPRSRGLLDCGPNFYAPNTMQLADGRRLVWGWVNGFPGGHGWNGCLSLPRQLALSRDGQLWQEPAPELSRLRGKLSKWQNLSLSERSEVPTLPKTNAFELSIQIDLQKAEAVTLELQSGDKAAQPIKLRFNRAELTVMDSTAPLHFTGSRKKLNLRIFVDRSVLEVFANETACITKAITPLSGDPTLALQTQGGHAKAELIEAWPMKAIW
jgi:beta-fructofuranosidase